MKSNRRIALFILSAFLAAVALTAAHAEDKPTAVIVPQNNYQAYAAGVQAAHQAKADQCDSKTNALKGSAATCKDDVCRLAFGILIDKACVDGQGAGTVAAIAPPPVEKPWYVELKDTVLDFTRGALPVVDRVLASRDSRLARESAERQTLGLYGTFSGIHGQTVTGMTDLGTAGINGVRDTATAGFGSLERTAAAAFKNPTYNINVNGNDNNLFGSASTRTYTNNCTSGQAGSSSGTTGSPAGGPSGQVPCTISK